MSDNHKYLHLKDTGLSVPNLMTYFIDFKIKRIRKFISPISIFDETTTNIFKTNFNLEPKLIVFSGSALTQLFISIAKYIHMTELQEAFQLFNTYRNAELKSCNIIPIFGNLGDPTLFKNPKALKNLLADRITPSPRSFNLFTSYGTPIFSLNYLVASKRQDNYNPHIYNYAINDTHFLMDRKLLVTRAQADIDLNTYKLFAQYISTAHKELLRPQTELEIPSHSPSLQSIYIGNTKSKTSFKRLINRVRFQHTNEILTNQLTSRHLRDNIHVTPKQLANTISSISATELSARATNNAYYILTRLSLSPHRIALIEKRPDKACPLCFKELGITERNNQYHNFFSCLIPQFMRKFLYYTWYKHAGIFINVDEDSYYMLNINMHMDTKTNGKAISKKNRKFVHLSYICSHLITKKLINNPATTSSWTALKRFINHHFKLALNKSTWHNFPPEFFHYDRISSLPSFKNGPPFQPYPVQMTNYLHDKLLPEEAKIHRLHQLLEEHNLTEEHHNEQTQPAMETMRQIQVKNNQLMALIASEINANSTEISHMKMEFKIFWAADAY